MQISSQNRIVLVVGDVHQDVARIKRIVNAEQADAVVCTGDWFDSYAYDTDLDVTRTCNYLRQYIHTGNCFTVMGNHDLHYFYSHPDTVSSGYEPQKKELIREVLNDHWLSTRNKILWYVWVDDWLVTHAGVHPSFIPPQLNVYDKREVDRWMAESAHQASSALIASMPHWFWAVGAKRQIAPTDLKRKGGLIWLDFDDEFETIPGLKQIVGHSSSSGIRGVAGVPNTVSFDRRDICVDCGLAQYLIINNGVVTVKQYVDL